MKIQFSALWFGVIMGTIIMLGLFAMLQLVGIEVFKKQEAQAIPEIAQVSSLEYEIAILENELAWKTVLPSPQGLWPSTERVNGYLVLEVPDTGSMEPVLNGSSQIIVSGNQTVQVGDIAVWLNPDTLEERVHRIIADRGAYWEFKGDANNASEWVPKNWVLLRVIGILY